MPLAPTINVFWLALAFIIVGSGFLKANISVMVGQLYKLTDVRRDGADERLPEQPPIFGGRLECGAPAVPLLRGVGGGRGDAHRLCASG